MNSLICTVDQATHEIQSKWAIFYRLGQQYRIKSDYQSAIDILNQALLI